MPWDWVKLGLLFLSIADKLLDIARNKEQMDAGRKAAIAEGAVSILSKVRTKDEIRAMVEAMPEQQVDEELKELEP